MLPFKKIICPIDFSDPSYEALENAVEMASYFKAELCLLHVVPQTSGIPPDPLYAFEGPEEYKHLQLEDAELQLNELMKSRIPKDVQSQAKIEQGEAADEILRAAREEGADVIVIATHGLTGWRHMVFGSVAEKVVRTAPCPVLTIHATKQIEE
jgi:universal stress protein A